MIRTTALKTFLALLFLSIDWSNEEARWEEGGRSKVGGRVVEEERNGSNRNFDEIFQFFLILTLSPL